MTCKNCYHNEICPVWDEYNDIPYNDGYSDFCNNYDHFKDKSLIVELPCKVGDELFLADHPEEHYRLKRYEFIDERVVMTIECFEYQVCCKRFVDESFGKTVFLSKDEAEAKLKEIEND